MKYLKISKQETGFHCCFQSLKCINQGTINNASGHEPGRNVRLICVRVNLQQIKFDDSFRAEKALSWVLVKYLGVGNRVTNCC